MYKSEVLGRGGSVTDLYLKLDVKSGMVVSQSNNEHIDSDGKYNSINLFCSGGVTVDQSIEIALYGKRSGSGTAKIYDRSLVLFKTGRALL